MFDTWLLRSFVAVVDSGGFTRAARLLNSTQSTISAQIQRLEEDAGQSLFVRSTRSVRLTAAGLGLLGYARTILRLNDDARLRLSGERHAGRVRIGVSEDLTGSWLPRLLQRVSRHYPRVELELETGVGSRLFKMVESQELDLAIGGVCHAPTTGRKLWGEPLVWACSPDTRLANVLPLAFFQEPCPYREAALRALAGSHWQWRIVSTGSSLAGVRASAVAGLAITPLPLQTLEHGLRVLDTRYNLPRLPEVEYVLHSQDAETRSTVSALGQLIHEMTAEAGSGRAAKAHRRSTPPRTTNRRRRLPTRSNRG